MGRERKTERKREEVHVSQCGYEVTGQPQLSVPAFHLVRDWVSHYLSSMHTPDWKLLESIDSAPQPP